MDDWFRSRIEINDKHPSPKHKHYLLGEGQQRIFIIGASGTGKTTLLRSIIPMFSDSTTHLYICSCVENNAIHDQIGKWCKSKRIEYEKFTEPRSANRAISDLVSEKNLDNHVVIIFDDFMKMNGKAGYGNDPYNLLVTECVNWRRNDNFSIVVICQYYTGLAPRTRVSINRRFVFKCESKHARMLVEMDVGPVFEDSKVTFDDCYKRYISGHPYNYLCISSNPPAVYAITFDENKNTRIIPIIAPATISGGSIKSRNPTKMGATPEQIGTIADGEISAGNDAPETRLLSLAEKIVTEEKPRIRAKYVKEFTKIYNESDICADAADRIIKDNGLEKYVSYE
jgi:ABC-type oligopeptide transport system ATPase subunit